MGRVTLNPVPHIDILGTIIFPLIGMLSGALMFGWAKPVPVNTLNMRDPKNGHIWVSLAGPLSNGILAIIFFALFKVLFASSLFDPEVLGTFRPPLKRLVGTGLTLNITLMIFNLIPIPPLDGSHVLRNLLTGRAQELFDRLESFGFMLLILLLYTGVTGMILFPVLNVVAMLLGVSLIELFTW